jgi:di/tricarboxylate transporter
VTAPQIAYLVILVAAFALLLTERLRNDVVAVLIVLALAGARVLSPRDAVSGFSSEPALVVAAIFVLSAAMQHTGLAETLGAWIGRLAGGGYTRAVAVLMGSVALLSAFTHHVTTTAVMLPVTLKLARERTLAPSRLLMPLSFAASLGTTITIIGAPAFLVASAVLQQHGRPGLGIFSIAPIGLALSAVGTLFMMLIGRFLLPAHTGSDVSGERFRLNDYFTEVSVLPTSPLLDRTVADVEADDHYDVKVMGLVREGRKVRAPLGSQTLAEGDVLLVRTTPDQLVNFRAERGVELHPVHQYEPGRDGDGRAAGEDGDDAIADRLVQAVIAPGSDLVGRTLGGVDFRGRYGAIVLSLWRQNGWLTEEMSKVRLRVGDVLVLQGNDDDLDRVARDPGFLMIMPFRGEPRLRRKAPLAGAIMVATVVAASFNVPLEIATMGGAALMVLLRCVTVGQAYRAIDSKVYVFIAGAIPLGIAMEKTGTSKLLAGWLKSALAGWHEMLVLGAIFAIVAVLTQFMSDSATTALFAPVAAALAEALGHVPEPYVVTVAMAAVASFLTPIGHHGNLLIYGPGRYRFADFVRVGTPLTILVGIVVVFMAPLLWRG